ncbi:MAG: hypothetical protein ACR2NX_13410 [Chthoniobacterales bacterium]
MKNFPTLSLASRAFRCSALIAISLAASFSSVASGRPKSTSGGVEIECLMPDGHLLDLTSANPSASKAAALIMGDETLNCPLTPGLTTFVIKLPSARVLDRFSFVNENCAATGQLSIAVANEPLAHTSPKWTTVDGEIAFTGKRLVNLSMVGVEARYLRLSFNVEKPGRIVTFSLLRGNIRQRLAIGALEPHFEISQLIDMPGEGPEADPAHALASMRKLSPLIP